MVYKFLVSQHEGTPYTYHILAPLSEPLPPMIFLATTGCLRARSARLFVLSTSGFLQPETNYPLVLADFPQTPSSDATYTVVLINSASAPHTFSVRDEFSKIDFRLGASYERAFIAELQGKE
jgi:hypothetical protein